MKKLTDYLKQNQTKILVYIITVGISALLLVLGNKFVAKEGTMFLGGYDDEAATAVVTKIVSVATDDEIIGESTIGQNTTVIFECELTRGERKGEIVTAVETITAFDTVPLKLVEVGDKIIVTKAFEGEGFEFYLNDYNRTMPLWVLGIAFVLLVLIFGRFKGVNTIISLGFTCIAVFAVFVPAVLAGKNIYLWAIITCIYITIMTLLITNGYNKKTLAAIIGCSCGVVVAGLLTLIASRFLNLSGITGDDTVYIKQNFDIDLNAVIFAGVILGSLGAVMDVSVSISSSLKEIHDQVEKPTFAKLVKSGVTIGRDIMGTMANTLVLAYIGSELSATLLAVVYSSSLTTLFSREKIVEEVLQALVGSIGILLTIPLTAVVSSALYMNIKPWKSRKLKTNKKDKYYIEPSDEPSLFIKTQQPDDE